MTRYKFLLRVLILIVLAFSMVGTAFADEPVVQSDESSDVSDEALDLHTAVSNDGLVMSVKEAAAFAGGGIASHSFAGSGELSDEGLVTDEVPVKPVEGDRLDASSVIGADGRIRVNPTTGFPSRAIAYLYVTWGTHGSGSCTGWFIGPRTVATAGHCVYDKAHGWGWATSIVVYPGRNGATKPYGSTTSHRLWSVSGWTGSGNSNYDYGAIQTNSAKGNTVGWFGFRWQSSNTFAGNYTVRGYPGDKPTAQLWTMNGTIVAETYKLRYTIDTAPGQSGSPVYNNYAGCGYCGAAIHTYGAYGSPLRNAGTRIRQPVFNNLLAWKNAAYP